MNVIIMDSDGFSYDRFSKSDHLEDINDCKNALTLDLYSGVM